MVTVVTQYFGQRVLPAASVSGREFSGVQTLPATFTRETIPPRPRLNLNPGVNQPDPSGSRVLSGSQPSEKGQFHTANGLSRTRYTRAMHPFQGRPTKAQRRRSGTASPAQTTSLPHNKAQRRRSGTASPAQTTSLPHKSARLPNFGIQAKRDSSRRGALHSVAIECPTNSA